MRRAKRALLAVSVLLLLALVPMVAIAPQEVFAYNPLEEACSQDQADNSTACANKDGKDNAITGNDNIIERITRVIAMAGGTIAVIVIIIYGMQLIFSYGDSSKATTARNAILAATVGLVIIVVAQSIVVFLVRNL